MNNLELQCKSLSVQIVNMYYDYDEVYSDANDPAEFLRGVIGRGKH